FLSTPDSTPPFLSLYYFFSTQTSGLQALHHYSATSSIPGPQFPEPKSIHHHHINTLAARTTARTRHNGLQTPQDTLL
ncbi:hypothetical protein DL89DRAFT_320823, partial [Linderina pennispora]